MDSKHTGHLMWCNCSGGWCTAWDALKPVSPETIRAVNNFEALLGALEGLRDDLQTRLDAATEGRTVADGLVNGEDANRSWRSWLFDVMSTHGDIARAVIEATKDSSHD